jgi:hypothetical protein
MAATNDSLSSLLRGEISATETYTQALEKFAGQAEEVELRRFRDDHRTAANTLRQHIHHHGGQAPTSSGPWGAWAKLVEGTAKALGKEAALKALKEGEEHGIKEHEQALNKRSLQADCKSLIRTQLLPQAQTHVSELDRMMKTQVG